jgi:hypothetical protein
MRRIIFCGFTFVLFTAFVFGAELERYSGQSEDDGQETVGSGFVNTSFNYIELRSDLGRWGGAYRFPNITIPQGATIDSAYISLRCYVEIYTSPVDSIACEDVDSASILETGYSYDISERWDNRTDAVVLWDEDDVRGPTGRDSTPDLSALVQEIVDRTDWKSGNAIIFLFKNTIVSGDSAYYETFSWDESDHTYAAILYVNYTPGTAVPDEESLPLNPTEFLLDQNYPNPFNLETNIIYGLPMGSKVKLTIYNLLGQRVRTLVDGYQTPGYKSLDWDATDDKGNVVASGIYFYRIQAGEFTQTRKITLLR